MTNTPMSLTAPDGRPYVAATTAEGWHLIRTAGYKPAQDAPEVTSQEVPETVEAPDEPVSADPVTSADGDLWVAE